MKNSGNKELTQKENAVIKAYINDDFVSDYGFESKEASAWLEGFHKDAGINETSFPGVMSSLVKKDIINTNGESFNLTEKGIIIAKKIK